MEIWDGGTTQKSIKGMVFFSFSQKWKKKARRNLAQTVWKESVRIVQRVRKSFSEGQGTKRRKKNSGKKLGAHDKKLEKLIVKTINIKRISWIRDVAKKFNTSVGMIQRTKKSNGLKKKKQKNAA